MKQLQFVPELDSQNFKVYDLKLQDNIFHSFSLKSNNIKYLKFKWHVLVRGQKNIALQDFINVQALWLQWFSVKLTICNYTAGKDLTSIESQNAIQNGQIAIQTVQRCIAAFITQET